MFRLDRCTYSNYLIPAVWGTHQLYSSEFVYSLCSLLLYILANSCVTYMPFEPDHPGARAAPTLRAPLH